VACSTSLGANVGLVLHLQRVITVKQLLDSRAIYISNLTQIFITQKRYPIVPPTKRRLRNGIGIITMPLSEAGLVPLLNLIDIVASLYSTSSVVTGPPIWFS
jgi:hypothetical protein